MEFAALETYLLPLKEIFLQDGVNEISINKPGEVWIEQMGNLSCEKIEIFSLEHLQGLAKLIAQSTEQRVSEENPLLSATLPAGYRVQIVMPPACEPGTIIFSIRKQSTLKWTLDDYEKMGAFAQTTYSEQIDERDIELAKYLEVKDTKSFLEKL